MTSDPVHFAPEAIWLEVEKVIRSRDFAGSQRGAKFLRYIVEQSLAGTADFKEYSIAIEVFGKDSSYDPQVDSTVRVEASRVRSRLTSYYQGEGKDDPLRIEIPKGGYAPIFVPGHRAGDFAVLHPPAETPTPPVAVFPAPAISSSSFRPSILRRVVGGVALLVVLVAAGFLYHRGGLNRSASPPAIPVVSIAVLPFSNRTGDPANDYLADGMTEALIRQLSEIPTLKVTSRATIFRLRKEDADTRTLGQKLGVGTVLTGDLRGSAGQLEVNAELSAVRDGSVIFSRRYLPEATDLMPVQADVLQDLIRGLHVELDVRQSAQLLKPASLNADAYRLFLRGEQASRGNSPEELHAAIGYFQQAVDRDPNFDLAWVSLAQTHLLLGIYFEAPKEQMPLVRRYAEHALKLNPSLGEAHASVGMVDLLYDWNVGGAETELALAGGEKRALSVLSCTAHLMELSGHARNAEEQLDSLLAYDPQNVGLIAELGCVAYYRHRFEEALGHYKLAQEMDSTSPIAYWGMSKSLSQEGRYRESIAALDQFRDRNGFEPVLITAERGYALGLWGKHAEAKAVIDQLLEQGKTSFVDPYLVSTIYLASDNRPMAFEWLEKAYDERSSFLISILTEPKWAKVQDDARFEAVVEKMRSH